MGTPMTGSPNLGSHILGTPMVGSPISGSPIFSTGVQKHCGHTFKMVAIANCTADSWSYIVSGRTTHNMSKTQWLDWRSQAPGMWAQILEAPILGLPSLVTEILGALLLGPPTLGSPIVGSQTYAASMCLATSVYIIVLLNATPNVVHKRGLEVLVVFVCCCFVVVCCCLLFVVLCFMCLLWCCCFCCTK